MLSYRHAFHAGNHADVLKHLTLIALLRHFNAKESPWCYLDSHSGKGYYDLTGSMAQKNQEYRNGIDRLWLNDWEDPLLQHYCELVRKANPADPPKLRRYLGSPAIARELCREQDKLVLMELHSQEFELLKQNFKNDPRVHLHQRDGFEGLAGMVPPSPRRGLALIDPAYEVKTDYQTVVTCIQKMYSKWQTGVVALWFPLLAKARDRSEWLIDQINRAGLEKVLLLELKVAEQDADQGMHGSGMILINTPWQLDRILETSLRLASAKLDTQCDQPLSVRWLSES